MSPAEAKERERDKTRRRAAHLHQGPGHWHVEKRSRVWVCRGCGARIPRWKDPSACPECGAGGGAG